MTKAQLLEMLIAKIESSINLMDSVEIKADDSDFIYSEFCALFDKLEGEIEEASK
jgi:glycine cleavage system regulatory protein